MRNQKSIIDQKAENIIRLGSMGYSYNRIQQELGVSKGTISYHLGKGQKEKVRNRTTKYRDEVGYKFARFRQNNRKKSKVKTGSKKTNMDCRIKFKGFRLSGGKMKYKAIDQYKKFWPDYTQKNQSAQAINQNTNKLDFDSNGKPIMYPFIRCKYTDLIINAISTLTHIDHIDGDRHNNTLSNMAIVSRESNQAKSNMSPEQHKEYCENYLKTYNKYRS